MRKTSLIRRFVIVTIALFLFQFPSVYAQQDAGLPTTPIWKNIITVLSKSHCSGQEQELSQFIAQFAKSHGADSVFTDTARTVLVRLRGNHGMEKYKPICLQVHLDMVCDSKSGAKDIFPRVLQRKGSLAMATGTTAGFDDGIGDASLLTIIEDTTITHGPLELLFTAGEESGFTGAQAFDYTKLKSRTIYNLDSEEEGILTIGSAGGARIEIKIPLKTFYKTGNFKQYAIKVSDLKGGHSGVDINKNRSNAIKIMAALLKELPKNVYLDGFVGGSAINTIPRFSGVFIWTTDTTFLKKFEDKEEEILRRFPERAKITIEETGVDHGSVKTKLLLLTPRSRKKLISFIEKLPHGVIKMESSDTSMVRTSNNVAQIDNTPAGTATIKCLIRSSSNKDIDSVIMVMQKQSIAAGGTATVLGKYSGWEPDFKSSLVQSTTDTYEQLFHKKMVVQTIHAGLECGLFAEKLPDAKIVSFGPTVTGAHTPDEATNIESVDLYWKFLLTIIQKKQ